MAELTYVIAISYPRFRTWMHMNRHILPSRRYVYAVDCGAIRGIPPERVLVIDWPHLWGGGEQEYLRRKLKGRA